MTYSCSNPDCKISETGNCLDAFKVIDECPSSRASDEVDTIDSESIVKHFDVDEGTEQSAETKVEFRLGTTLEKDIASEILKASKSKVIACVGPSEVGKTTLLASIYEYINKNVLDIYNFAGSETLYSFEQICYLARAASGNKTADTPRTLRTGDASFYHLAFHNGIERNDILFADRAGEEYSEILDDSAKCNPLFEIRRCNTFLLLIDAEKLTSASRHTAQRKVTQTIEILKNEQMLTFGTHLIIVMTCYDRTTLSNRKIADQALGKIQTMISAILDGMGLIIDQHIVAARPNNLDEFKAGHGVKELLLKIIDQPITIHNAPTAQRKVHNNRIFLKLQDKE